MDSGSSPPQRGWTGRSGRGSGPRRGGAGHGRGGRGIGSGGRGGGEPPFGYTTTYPVIGGPDVCPHCFCCPCVVSSPPSFLFGSSAADLRNVNKRRTLYKNFWKSLKEIGLWSYEPYLVRKYRRTIRTDVREIMPHCVTNVSEVLQLCKLVY